MFQRDKGMYHSGAYGPFETDSSNALVRWRVEAIALIATLGCLVSYLPVIFDFPLMRGHDALLHTATSFLFQQFLIVAIAISIPMMIDALLDHNLSIKIMLPRWLMLLSLSVPNLVMYANSIVKMKSYVQIFFCSMHSREILYLGSLLGHYVSTYPRSSKVYPVVGVMMFFTLGICIHVFRLNPIGGKTAFVLGLYMTMLSTTFIIAMCLYQIYRWAHRYDEYERYTAVYIMCLLASHLVKWLLYILVGFDTITPRTCPYFALFTVIDAAVGITVSILPGRMAREEATYAKHLLETKRNFVRYVSHEIRTPLNTVYMGIQLATQTLDKIAASQHVLDMMRDIQDSCGVAIEILNDLLMFDKLESEGLRLEKQIVLLKPLVMKILNQFTIQAQQALVSYHFVDTDHYSPDVDNILVDVDINKISQTIRNLVSNALKFTPAEGQVDVHVHRVNRNSDTGRRYSNDKMASTSEYVRIEVRDTGPGISKENQDRLFHEIVQFDADSLQNGKGSGLGLWISKSIVDMHQGVIGVDSEGQEGKGSVFYIELPIIKTPNPLYQDDKCNTAFSSASTSATTKTPSSLSDAMLPSSLRVGRILIVDDSKFNRRMLRKAVVEICDDIIEAEDGVQAVQAVQQSLLNRNPLQVILMDSIMPRMGGREAIHKIRTQLGYTGIIIGVTGNVLADDIQEFKAHGANAVLGKPLQINELFNVLDNEMNNSTCKV